MDPGSHDVLGGMGRREMRDEAGASRLRPPGNGTPPRRFRKAGGWPGYDTEVEKAHPVGRPVSRGMSLVEVVVALAIAAAAVLIAASGLIGQARMVQLAQHRNAVARILEAAVTSVRSGELPLEDAAFTPPLDPGLEALSIRIQVAEARPGLYRVAAVARWRERGRPLRQELETLVWRP